MRLGLDEGFRRRRGRRNRFADGGSDLRVHGILDRGLVGRGLVSQRLVDVVDPQGVADVLLQRGHDVAAGQAGGGFLDLVKALLEVGHFGLPHGFLELALEFGGHLAGLAHPLPDHAQHARQFFRADSDQRDNRDDDQFTPADVEHEFFRSRETSAPRYLDQGFTWTKVWLVPRFGAVSAFSQPACFNR